MISVSVQLFWAIRNSLAPGARLHHAAIPACALWHVTSGELYARLQSEDGSWHEAKATAGDWLLMPHLLARTIEARSDATWVSIGLTAVAHNADLLAELASTSPWRPNKAHLTHGKTLLDALTGSSNEGANYDAAMDDALFRVQREALGRALFAWVWLQRGTRPLSLAARGGPAWLVQARESALAEPSVSISRLARQAGYSDAAFRREWRRWTGVSPRDWLQSQRIDIATGLLGSTDLTVGEIARRSGFETAGQFTRAFKARTGVAPQTFRTLQREG